MPRATNYLRLSEFDIIDGRLTLSLIPRVTSYLRLSEFDIIDGPEHFTWVRTNKTPRGEYQIYT